MADDFDVEAMLEAPFHKGQVIFLFFKFVSSFSMPFNKIFFYRKLMSSLQMVKLKNKTRKKEKGI